jgi:hypothetical protein
MFNQDSRVEVKEKLILLYSYQAVNVPVTGEQINDILLSLSLIEYFPLQQYTIDLVENGMLEEHEVDKERLYMITEQGINTLSFFKDRISSTITAKIDEVMVSVKKDMKKSRLIKAEHQKIDEANYMVDLSIKEGPYNLVKLTLSVPSNKTAKEICQQWKDDAVGMYSKIIALFDKDEE